MPCSIDAGHNRDRLGPEKGKDLVAGHFTLKSVRGIGSFAGDHGNWTNTRLANKNSEIVLKPQRGLSA